MDVSTFRYCTGTLLLGNEPRICHLLSNDQQAGEACPGSYILTHSSYIMCEGTIVVPGQVQQQAMLAAWKMGGWPAVAAIVEEISGWAVQGPYQNV